MEPTAASSNARPSPAESRDQRGGGDWPRTWRVLPWGVAGFITMLFLAPFQSITLAAHLPIDMTLDRVALAVLLLLWLGSIVCPPEWRPRHSPSGMDAALAIFLLVCLASMLVNAERIAMADELQVAIKKLSLLTSYIVFFYIVSTVVRPSEVRRFSLLVIFLGVIVGIGVIYEYRTRTNLFYDWAKTLAPPGFDVGREVGSPKFGRPQITGPTSHGLAATAVLALALPFALVGLLQARGVLRKLLFGLAGALILAGAMSTLRKTAMIAPLAGVAVLIAYRPRAMLRIAPVGALFVAATMAASPGALSSIGKQLAPSRMDQVGTVQDRVADYDATRPDRWAYPVLGRGYGTYDANKYRLLDNQYLGIWVGTGALGLAAYIGLWIGAFGVAHTGIRAGDPRRSAVALAAGGAVGVFAVVSALFDVLAFPQVPYIFLTASALAVAASRPGLTAGRDRPHAGARARRFAPSAPRVPAETY